MIEIQSDTGTWYQRWGVRASNLGGQVIGDCMVEREKEVGGVERNAGVKPVWGVMGKLKGGGRAGTWGCEGVRS